MKITAQEISNIVQGEIEGDPDVIINRPSKIEEGEEGTISFLANPKYHEYAYSTKASVLLVSKDFHPEKTIKPTLIKVENVYSSLSKLLSSFETKPENSGISALSSVSDSSIIHETVSIGNFAVVSEGVNIGENTIISDQVFLGKNVKIGKNCLLYPGVKIYHDCEIGNDCIIHANAVIGSDGFGFATDESGEYKKIPQIGNVVIEDQVEIGSNTTIDRATMGSTMIHKGVKLDNLIQVGHNVSIGQNTVIAAQTGIAGSTKIGRNCQIGGQVGFVGHLNIPDGTRIQAQSGIASSPKEENTKLFGTPAIDYMNYVKSYAHFKQLPALIRELNTLKKEIEHLKSSK